MLGLMWSDIGQRCSDTRMVTFQDVEIPEENVLGTPGEGFKSESWISWTEARY